MIQIRLFLEPIKVIISSTSYSRSNRIGGFWICFEMESIRLRTVVDDILSLRAMSRIPQLDLMSSMISKLVSGRQALFEYSD
ncbi:MAG: hypothetical protein Crog4KO_08980 [Crocinitomicaceae bacterium]